MTFPKNSIRRVKITDFGTKGEGIGRFENEVIFVTHAVPGDDVDVQILKSLSRHAFGKIVRTHVSSPLRVSAPCLVAHRCGGCQIQHVSYEAQLAHKMDRIRQAFGRIAGIESAPIAPIVPMQNPFGYRNKLQAAIGHSRSRPYPLEIGLFSVASHHIVDTDVCLIQNDAVSDVIRCIRGFILDTEASVYNERDHTGLIRHLVVRRSEFSGQLLVGIVINGKDIPDGDQLIERLSKIPNMSGILWSHNTKAGDTVLGTTQTLKWGSASIEEQIRGLRYQFSLPSFFQTNPIQAALLFAHVSELVSHKPDAVVWDLFCGVGSIALQLAQNVKHVVGVDVVTDAIADAEANALLNGIENVTFFAGDALSVFSDIQKTFPPNVVILDPPRKGCDPILIEALLAVRPEEIIYVSCDPATLARDIKLLIDGGYDLVGVTPFDMFPHTVHVEAVAVLKVRKAV